MILSEEERERQKEREREKENLSYIYDALKKNIDMIDSIVL